MNVITLASRKGGVGKSTLTAHLGAYAHLIGHRCMVVDADPQGSLTLWHSMRADNRLVLQNAAQGINRLVASALLNGYQWMFIDTAPTTWLVVQEAIRAATMVVIPVRPGFFDLAAVRETVATARTPNGVQKLQKALHARVQQALCGGHQRRPGQAGGQGGAGGRPVASPVRAAVRPGMVGPDQPTRGTPGLSHLRRERGRDLW
jgi:cellulose biosynthesis protein BcsQ